MYPDLMVQSQISKLASFASAADLSSDRLSSQSRIVKPVICKALAQIEGIVLTCVRRL
jgi:hypothetical protein